MEMADGDSVLELLEYLDRVYGPTDERSQAEASEWFEALTRHWPEPRGPGGRLS
jgi:hypothetical protein